MGAALRDPLTAGMSFECGTGLHAPLCDGRNCSCSCHGPASAVSDPRGTASVKFKMDWSELTDDQVGEEHQRDLRYFAHAAATGSGSDEAHARNAAESAGELKRRGIDPSTVS